MPWTHPAECALEPRGRRRFRVYMLGRYSVLCRESMCVLGQAAEHFPKYMSGGSTRLTAGTEATICRRGSIAGRYRVGSSAVEDSSEGSKEKSLQSVSMK